MCYVHVYNLFTCTYVGMFYYILGNIRPELRSTHKVIQLIACVENPVLSEYGFHKILQPFIEEVNLLCSVSTCILKVKYT